MRLLPEGNLPQLETVPSNRTLPGGGDLPTLEQVTEETGTIEAPTPGTGAGRVLCSPLGGCHPADPPPPPPPPPSEPVPNHVVQQTPPGGGEITEQNLPELVPICTEGQELDEDTNLCVPTECPEGQELNEETGICVLEEQPVEQQEQAAEEPEEQQQTEEEQEQPEPEENQPSEDSNSEDNGNN